MVLSMDYSGTLTLAHNAALLLAMFFIYNMATDGYRTNISSFSSMVTGIAIGFIGIIIMLTPWEYTPGVIVDTRTVLLCISGLFFGTVPTLIAIAITALLRILQDGEGVFTGVAVIASSGSLGIFWRYYRKQSLSRLTFKELYLFGFVVHIISLGLLFIMPWNIAIKVFLNITIPVLIIFPLITVALGKLFVQQIQNKITSKKLKENEFLFRSQFDLGSIGIAITDSNRHWLRVNSHLCKNLGYSHKELLSLSWHDLIHRDDVETDSEQFNRMVSGNTDGYSLDTRFIHKKGHIVYIHMTVSCYRINNKIKLVIAGILDTSESKNIEDKLLNQKEQLISVLAGSELGFWDWDLQKNTVERSSRWYEILGYDSKEVTNVHSLIPDDIIHPDDKNSVKRSISKHLNNESSQHKLEYRVLTKDGNYKWILDAAKIVKFGPSNQPLRMCGTYKDITDRKLAEESLQLSSMVFQNSSEAMIVTDGHGNILKSNPAFTVLTGYSSNESQGRTPQYLISTHQDHTSYHTILRAIHSSGHWQGEIQCRRKTGELYIALLNINAIYDTSLTIQLVVIQLSDITEKKKSEEIIWKQANYDTLTNLPNRRLFFKKIKDEKQRADKIDLPFAVLFIDLDNFKRINDTLGHDMGDRLLEEAAQRISDSVRNNIDIVSRLGGDEFTIILPQLDDLSIIDEISTTIISSFSQPFSLSNEEVYTSPSIGIAVYKNDDEEIDTLIKKADKAMYVAKSNGRNCICYHEDIV
ncbi:diguanylate cyclase [Photobacterium marinum]|uniref:Diguanylate cyclase n=1 Tax=Photobacterium marinum TaxID=1056511 RepID=L8J6L6_9GAMM|nr:PAS domain S-box protein [Photobacterium marinum]ELR64500.1 diguanylate cyclase [Photobacterium marinum]